MNYIKKFFLKRRYAREIEEQAFKKEADAGFELNVIPDIQKLKETKQKELEQAEKELSALDPNDHKRETRDKRKELETKAEALKKELANFDGAVAYLNKKAESDKQEVASLRTKAKFVKNL